MDNNVGIMADRKISSDEEEGSTDSSDDEEQGPARKRKRLSDIPRYVCLYQRNNPDHINQERKKSNNYNRIKVTDPLSDLTYDQRVVLYTLFLCCDYNGVNVDDDVTMGDIDVRRTLSELVERGLVERDGAIMRINIDRDTEIMRSYRENCLLSDIDRDFYLQVASNDSLTCYTEEYLLPSAYTEQPVISLMRLIMEGRAQDTLSIDNLKSFHVGFADKEFQNFIQEWRSLRNLDLMSWADGISYEEAVRFLSAYTILEGFDKGFTEMKFDHKQWSILISILMSKKYTFSINALWEENLRKIHGTFPSLRESNHDMCTTEAVELIKDLVYNDKLLTVNGDVSSGTVEFVSDDVRHQVMGHFVLNCLKTDKDYKNYLQLSSADSMLEYIRTWWYNPDEKERCVYLPQGLRELFIRRLGIDAIRHVMVEEREDRGKKMYFRRDVKTYNTIRDIVSKILKVPREILEWNSAERSRYAECVKKGTQTIHRAREMIVGCAGAGKSTLLKRLQKRGPEELKKVQSTVGLEVHEDIFEIIPESDCLEDPLSDLTNDQRVVLYTLFLCCDYNGVNVDDDVTMGDIDVRRTLSELVERGLVERDGAIMRINIDRDTEIMRSYRENCLLSDIDRDFYLQVASNDSLTCYTEEYLLPSAYTEQPVITLMRLIMEGRAQDTLSIDNLKSFHVGFADKEFQNFIQEWRSLRNLDLMSWADGISYEEAVRFLSAYTILEGFDKGFTEMKFDHKQWSILISILMSKKYTISINALWEEKLRKIHGTFPSLRESNHDMCTTEAVELIKDLVYNDKLLTVNGDVSSGTVEFVSDDVRHQVMGHFVLNCLKTDKDYKNYLQLSSADSMLEYIRTWWYNPDEKERCVYLPQGLRELFIRRLGIDAIRHVMVEEREDRGKKMYFRRDVKTYNTIRDIVSKILKVPKEILEWNSAARSRYAECVKKGTQTIHRARAMIVGCAGAGKSTLLIRLQKRSPEELKKVQSTVGLEVHEDIFEIIPESDCLEDLPLNTDKEGKQLLSILDFGGQCAYYACHQVYLSRRAFYLLVIDMCKAFDEKVDPSMCEQEGTMFMDWTYGEYMLFWLKSVHTYCDDDAPVIIVGTHLDGTKRQDANTLYNSILEYLQFDKHLKTHIKRKHCFVTGLMSDSLTSKDMLSELEKCIVAIAKEDRWKETIPTDWALCEVVLKELREQKMRMTSVARLSKECFGENKEKYSQMNDILKFYHGIGVLLHFDESSLAETVIIDIQWFVDSFKNIVTDPNHVRDIVDNNRDWLSFYKSGHILDSLLTTIWNRQHFEMDPFERSHETIPLERNYEMITMDICRTWNLWKRNQSKVNLLQYMQRLGLIAVGTYAHYIPCMNKMTFGIKEENFFQTIQNKTSVLVFRFHFLPYFFYFRLIVACLTKTNGEWTVLEDNGLCLYKNVACFVYKQHAVALAVNRYSIQLQVFQPSQVSISKYVTLEIRDSIERLLNGMTSNFHKKVMYTMGYQCSKQEVFREHDDCFVEENKIYGKGKFTCPKHGMISHHILSESDLLSYWKEDVQFENADLDELMDGDECTNLSEPEIKKLNFTTFEKLTKIGRNALQIYFDRIFPPSDLSSVLINHKHSLQQGHYKLNSDQCSILFPVDRSIPSSADFDVTIMYKLLRNYGPDLPTPTNGWGKKPDIGQRLPTDDMERIRLYRNEVEHKTTTTSFIEKDDFKLKWEDLSQAILRLSNGSLKKDVMTLRQQR